jgi:hypothetical protein
MKSIEALLIYIAKRKDSPIARFLATNRVDPKLNSLSPSPSKNSGFNKAIKGPKNIGDINKNKIMDNDHE